MADKDLDEMLDTFSGIDRQIVSGAKNYRTLAASISKTNSLLTSKNWEIFSRFISGTGLWRIQNRLKATVMFLNEMQDGAERRRIAEAENLKNYAEIADNLEKAKSLQESLELAASGTAEEQAKALAFLREESQIFKGLEFQYGKGAKSLEKMGDLMQRQVDDAEKLRKIADKTAAKEVKGLKGMMARSKMLQSVKGFTDKVNEASEYSVELQKQINEAGGANPIDTLDISTAKESLDKNQRTVHYAQTKDGETKKISKKQYEAIVEMRNQNNKRFKLARKSANVVKSEFYKPFKKMGKMVSSIMKGIAKIVLGMAKLAISIFLVLMAIMVGYKLIEPYMSNIKEALMAMKKTFMEGFSILASGVGQVFGGFVDLFNAFMAMDFGAMWNAFGKILGGIVKIGVGLLMMTLGALLSAGWAFITSAFSDGTDMAKSALGKVIAGVANVIKGIAGVIGAVALVVGIIGLVLGAAFALPALIVAGIAIIAYKFMGVVIQHADWIAKGIINLKDGIMSVVSPIVNFLGIIKDFLLDIPTIPEIAKAIGDAVKKALDVGKKIGGKIKDFGKGVGNFLQLAEGGKISRSGLAIVGEKGPELVTLPRGAQVHSNSASKAMASSVTNHITVQVTGRVGASDTEIRDIANKVAREINTRMNRTSTSVVKF